MKDIIITLLLTATTIQADLFSEEEAKQYLIQYGYLENTTYNSLVSISEGIRDFQERNILAIDGTLNQETISLMKKPRCGVKDVVNYSIYPIKWRSTNLTWNIFPPSPDLFTYKRIATRAFKTWESESKLRLNNSLHSVLFMTSLS